MKYYFSVRIYGLYGQWVEINFSHFKFSIFTLHSVATKINLQFDIVRRASVWIEKGMRVGIGERAYMLYQSAT